MSPDRALTSDMGSRREEEETEQVRPEVGETFSSLNLSFLVSLIDSARKRDDQSRGGKTILTVARPDAHQ